MKISRAFFSSHSSPLHRILVLGMMLPIFANGVIREVQDEFTKAFPFLKIEFFRNTDSLRQMRHAGQTQVPGNSTIRQAWTSFKEEGMMEVLDTTTVHDLETGFRERFGLSVHVFRKSGNLWIETTMTENWTLKQQNEHGMEISKPFSRS